MEEETILSESNVVVTRSRFMTPGSTYAMSGITSVKASTERPVKGPLILIVLGVLVLLGGAMGRQAGAIVMSLILIAGGFFWLLKGVKYIVLLSSASGEVKALVSRDSRFIGRVIDALNQAIVRRG